MNRNRVIGLTDKGFTTALGRIVTLFIILLIVWVQSAEAVSTRTANMPNGVSITTTVDPIQHKVIYSWDFSNLAGDYSQISFDQPQFPSISLCSPDCVISNSLTEYIIFDQGGAGVESQLQLKYEGGAAPPRINSVELIYKHNYKFTGQFFDGSPGNMGDDGNVQVSFRSPPGGENSKLWAFIPQIQLITTSNTQPIANAGVDQVVSVGNTVTLFGDDSNDVDGDILTYEWTLISPGTSNASLSDSTSKNPMFVPDIEGNYVATLIVNDGILNSNPDMVKILALNAGQNNPSTSIISILYLLLF